MAFRWHGDPGIGCFMDDMTLALLLKPWAMESKAYSTSQDDADEPNYQAHSVESS